MRRHIRFVLRPSVFALCLLFLLCALRSSRADDTLPPAELVEGQLQGFSAARETLEETGWRPAELRPIGSYFPYNGQCDGVFNLFVTNDAEHVGDPTDPSESERIEWLTWPAVRAEIAAGRLGDGLSLTALLWLHMNTHADL